MEPASWIENSSRGSHRSTLGASSSSSERIVSKYESEPIGGDVDSIIEIRLKSDDELESVWIGDHEILKEFTRIASHDSNLSTESDETLDLVMMDPDQ